MQLFVSALLGLHCRRGMSSAMIGGMVKGESVVGMVGSRFRDDLRVGLGRSRGH